VNAHEIKVGERYVASVGGQDTTVRVLGEGDPGWFAYNEATGRTIHVLSPRRFRALVSAHYEPEPIPEPPPKPEVERKRSWAERHGW
jgi:hypothetical protein